MAVVVAEWQQLVLLAVEEEHFLLTPMFYMGIKKRSKEITRSAYVRNVHLDFLSLFTICLFVQVVDENENEEDEDDHDVLLVFNQSYTTYYYYYYQLLYKRYHIIQEFTASSCLCYKNTIKCIAEDLNTIFFYFFSFKRTLKLQMFLILSIYSISTR